MPSYLIISPKPEAQINNATALAKRQLCTSGPRKACAKCVNCLGVTKQIHPDLHTLALEPGKKTIGIDEVKNLISKVKYKPYLAKQQVAAIIGSQSLTPEGQNALLKTLEEPPENTVFILTVDDAHNVLPTIRSRCAPVHLKPAKAQASSEETEESEEEAPELTDIDKFLKFNLVDRFLEIERVAKRDEHTHKRVNHLLGSLTDHYYTKLHSEIKDQEATKSNSAILRKIDEARHQIARNVNTRLALENLMLYIPD